MSHVDSRLLHVAFTFLVKSVSNESAFFVHRAHPYRAFLRNHTRTKFTVTTAPTAPADTTASTPSGRSSILVFEPIEQSTYSLNYRAATTFLWSCQLVPGTTEQSIIGNLYQPNIQAVLSQSIPLHLKTSSKTTYLPVLNPGLQISQHIYTDCLNYE